MHIPLDHHSKTLLYQQGQDYLRTHIQNLRLNFAIQKEESIEEGMRRLGMALLTYKHLPPIPPLPASPTSSPQ